MSMIASSRERNRSVWPVSRRSFGRISPTSEALRGHRITNQICKESLCIRRLPGNIEMPRAAFSAARSSHCPFFTNDSLIDDRSIGPGPFQFLLWLSWLSAKRPASPERETVRNESPGHRERTALAAFQRYLLGEH